MEVKNDVVGESTLSAINKADKFNDWMYSTIAEFCKGHILEVGSGIGNISNCFIRDNKQIMLTDFNVSYCETLRKKYQHHKNVLGVKLMDLIDPNFDEKHQDLLGKFDTVFALNVVEHIQTDFTAIQNCKKLLRKGGHLIILVPSYDALYNGMDKELGHYRRYNKKKLSTLFIANDFEIIHKQYFNAMGVFGWFYTGKLLMKRMIPSSQMVTYNKLVPLFKVVDKALIPFWGLSTIVVGKKR